MIDAAKFGHLGVIELLLEHGADPNVVDSSGHAALYQALTSPYLGGPEDHVSDRIVELLLAHGAEIDGRGVVLALKNLPENDPRLTKRNLTPAKQVPKAEVRQKLIATPPFVRAWGIKIKRGEKIQTRQLVLKA